MSDRDSQVALIDNYHDGLHVRSAEHDFNNCRICFLLSEVGRWKAAHHAQVHSKRFKERLLKAIMAAVKEHGGRVIISRSGKTIRVEFEGITK